MSPWRFGVVRICGDWISCFVLPQGNRAIVFIEGRLPICHKQDDAAITLCVHEEVGPRRAALLDTATANVRFK